MKRALLLNLFVGAFWMIGCDSTNPAASNGCPTVVQGLETFACNQSSLDGLVLGKDDVFWGKRSGSEPGAIMRQSKTGGEPVVFASVEQGPFSMVLDSDFMYWLEADTMTGMAKVMKLALSGGDPMMGFTGIPNLRQILVDNGDIYLVVGDSDLGGYGISRLAAGSSTPEILVEKWKDGFFAVILDGADVFFSTTARELWRVPKLGGASSVVAGGLVEPLFMAPYASNVYITDRSGGTVWDIDETTGATTSLAQTDWLAGEIAVDEKNVYWFEFTYNYPPGTPMPSAFRTVARTGGSASTIAEISANDLVGDASHLYFTYGTNVLRYAK